MRKESLRYGFCFCLIGYIGYIDFCKLHQRRRAVADAIQKEHHVRVLDVVLKLDVDGTSSDESDHESGHGEATYFILRKHWRSSEVTKTLRALDALHLANRYKDRHEATSGAWPHFRTTHTSLYSRRLPVQRLPLNFYDSEWYMTCRDDSPLDYLDLQPSRMSHVDIPPFLVRSVMFFGTSP